MSVTAEILMKRLQGAMMKKESMFSKDFITVVRTWATGSTRQSYIIVRKGTSDAPGKDVSV